MGDLVLLLDQVQLLLDGGVVLELVLADLEQHLDHVLHAAVDVGLVQDVAELVEHDARNVGVHVLERAGRTSGRGRRRSRRCRRSASAAAARGSAPPASRARPAG